MKTSYHTMQKLLKISAMYNDIVGAEYEASRSYHKYSKRANSNTKPGWRKHVAAHHAEAKEAFKAWVQEGQPRQGPVLDYKKAYSFKV